MAEGRVSSSHRVAAPRQRNSRNDNDDPAGATIKEGGTPADWDAQPAKRRQKDTDARWTKKHGRTCDGCKNHVSVDARHKLVRRITVTDAARHDSGELDAVLDPDNTSSKVWGTAPTAPPRSRPAWPSGATRVASIAAPRATARSRRASSRAAATCARVRLVGHQATAMGGKLVRTIGMQNLTYNTNLPNS